MRLRPITDYLPKPMLPVQGKPLLEWVILQLRAYGIMDYLIAVSYLAEQIENYFGNGASWGIEIQYSRGANPAGKAGEVWRCRDLLNGESRFLVVPGDTISRLNYRDFIAFHEQCGGMATLALSTRYRLEVGTATVDQTGRVIGFREKMNLDCPVSTGAYLLEKTIFPYIEGLNPSCNQVDLPGDVFPILLSEEQGVYGFVCDYDWWDIGRIGDYETIRQTPLKQLLGLSGAPSV
jgi:NDP-sugar pyrophosphorylase family protein